LRIPNKKPELTNLKPRDDLVVKEKISAYLDAILDSLPVGVVAIDLGDRIVAFNPAAEKILGQVSEDILGKPYLEVMGPGAEEKYTLPYIVHSGQICPGKKEVKTQTGKMITVSFSNSLLKDTNGKIFGAAEIFSEWGESEQAQEEMRRVRTLAALGEMAALVAHEIKNPLGGIRGFAELLERDIQQSDPRKKSVKKIIEGVETLTRIVDTLLDHTRPVKLNVRKVEMVSFIEDSINFFEMDSSNQKSNVRMIKDYPQGKLHCNLDAEQFRQILLNLLRNAIQAMPEGGVIRIKMNREAGITNPIGEEGDPKAVLKVSDTGIGMSKEVQKKIFAPFFTTKEGGTGLGLFAVRKIVEAHGGEIQLESVPGQGTVVTIGLPMTE
jgi:PAS domain S-box-containing protein